MTAPSVSILVTTFCHERFVREALDSLVAQTTRDFEVIITDDASNDGTVDVIRAWLDERHLPATFIANPVNRGLSVCRNGARRIAAGEFICSLSGDDVYEPDRIARQLSCFRELPQSVAVVFSDASLVDANGCAIGDSFIRHELCDDPLPTSEAMFRRMLRGNFIPAPGVMARRAAIDAVGGYDESLFVDDWDMWLRLSHRYGFHHLPGALLRYRVLPTSMSHTLDREYDRIDSSIRTLAKWRGQCGDAEAGVVDSLWQLATRAMSFDLGREAARLMQIAGAASPHLRRRVLARLAGLPGGCALVRLQHRLRQSVAVRRPPAVAPMDAGRA